MTNTGDIRIGLAGLGSRGLYWLDLLKMVPGFKVVALCDGMPALHEAGLKRLGDQAAGVKTYSDYRAFLEHPGMDAVALTVRCNEQGAMAAMALEAGKHVSAEVPAAHTIEDCWRIVLAAERSGKTYLLGEQLRYAGFIDEWRDLVASGELGKVTYAEGQYFHYYVSRNFRDPATGRALGPEELAAFPNAVPSSLNSMPPIHYIVHDLSPLLKVIDDRVIEVVGMGTDSPSSTHPQVAAPDMQVALMKTAKGAVLRLAASFVQPHPESEYHWQQVIGTRGSVEWKRAGHDKPKIWLAKTKDHSKSDAEWGWDPRDSTEESRKSGHGGLDYHVHANFRDAVLGKRPLQFDVYKAMEVAAPSILAADSIAQGSRPMRVPDFRPGPSRAAGEKPRA